jgi:hypothetical protein
LKGQRSKVDQKLGIHIGYWVTMFRLVQMGIPWEVAENLTIHELRLASTTSASLLEASQNNKGQGNVDTNYENMAKYFGG